MSILQHPAPAVESFADQLLEAIGTADSDFVIGLAPDNRECRDNAREIAAFFRLVNAHNSAYLLLQDRHEADFDADGFRIDPDATLEEAAEMGREQGLSLRVALVPEGFSFDCRDAYLAAYHLAFDHAEAEALSDREDDWSDCAADDLDDRYQRYLDCERAEMGFSIGHIG